MSPHLLDFLFELCPSGELWAHFDHFILFFAHKIAIRFSLYLSMSCTLHIFFSYVDRLKYHHCWRAKTHKGERGNFF